MLYRRLGSSREERFVDRAHIIHHVDDDVESWCCCTGPVLATTALFRPVVIRISGDQLGLNSVHACIDYEESWVLLWRVINRQELRRRGPRTYPWASRRICGAWLGLYRPNGIWPTCSLGAMLYPVFEIACKEREGCNEERKDI